MTDKRLLWIKFYPRDWMSDSDLRRCSIAARGLWIDLLCLMSQGKDFGKLVDGAGVKLSEKDLASDCRLSEPEFSVLVAELKAKNIFSEDAHGIIYSRKMVRDESLRQKNSKNGKKGGSPILKNTTTEYRDKRLEGGLSGSLNPLLNPNAQNLSINQPTLEDCQAAARFVGMKPEQVEAFFHHYNAQGWVKKGGQPIRNLSSALATWKANDSRFCKSKDNPTQEAVPQWKRLELLEQSVSEFTARNPHPDRWTDSQRADVVAKRGEIKRIKAEMLK